MSQTPLLTKDVTNWQLQKWMQPGNIQENKIVEFFKRPNCTYAIDTARLKCYVRQHTYDLDDVTKLATAFYKISRSLSQDVYKCFEKRVKSSDKQVGYNSFTLKELFNDILFNVMSEPVKLALRGSGEGKVDE